MARMARRRFGISVALALTYVLSVPVAQGRIVWDKGSEPTATMTPAEQPDSKEAKEKAPAKSPAGILVRSKDGSDSLQGLCHDEGRYTICDVTEVRIIPPDIKRVDDDERNMLQEFKKDPEKAKKDLAGVLTGMKETTAKVRSDPTIGPKLR